MQPEIIPVPQDPLLSDITPSSVTLSRPRAKRKPSERQKRLAKVIIDNITIDEPLTGGEMLYKAGYAESMTTSKVGEMIDSPGVQEALADLGFTVDNAKKVVASIMLNEDADDNARLKATDQVFKVTGGYAPDKSVTITLDVNADAKKTMGDFNNFLKAQLYEATAPSTDKPTEAS